MVSTIQFDRFFVVMVKKGPAWASATDTELANDKRIHREHVDHLRALDVVVLSGPLTTNNVLFREMLVLKARSSQDVVAALQSDPAVENGRLAFEIFDWLLDRGTLDCVMAANDGSLGMLTQDSDG